MIVKCPLCGSDVAWSEKSPYRPFCSKKCQLIDLGEWAAAERSIPASDQTPEPGQDTPDIEDIESMLSQRGDEFFKH